jgi:hypothetical protein
MSCGDSGWRKMRREKPLQFYARRGVGAKATMVVEAAGAGLTGNFAGTDFRHGSWSLRPANGRSADPVQNFSPCSVISNGTIDSSHALPRCLAT